MAEKIKGEFLRIEEEKDGYWVRYTGTRGEIKGFKMPKEGISHTGFLAKHYTEFTEMQLAREKEAPKIERLVYELELWQLQALWPQMYIASARAKT